MDYSTGMPVAATAVAFGNLNFSGRFVASGQTISDAAGSYALTIAPGTYLVFQENVWIGTVHVLRTGTRGDLLRDAGLRCVARYGVVVDAETHRPLEGVRVRLGGQTVRTDSDGWYRIDLGCSGPIGIGTTFMYFDASGYLCRPVVVGRGIIGVERVDVFLGRHGLGDRFC